MLGGGDTGALARAHDWTATALGHPAEWPQPLRTIVALVLSAREPMYVAWGPQHLMIYNDACVELVGARHPALGCAFADIWPDVLALAGPMMAQTYAGVATRMEHISLPVKRRGQQEKAHFSFSLNPVGDADGGIAGVFCICSEITRQALAQRERALAEAERFRDLFDQSPGFVAVLRGVDHRYELANPNYRRLVGDRDLIGLTVREALPELENQGFNELLDQVWQQNQSITGTAVPIKLLRSPGAPPEALFLDFVYQPLHDVAGNITGIFVEGFDVTAARRAHDALRESEERLRLTIESATDYAILTTDNDGWITSWSPGAEAAFGCTREDAVGQPYTMIFVPEDQAAGVPAQELATAARAGLAIDERWHQRVDGRAVFMNGVVRPLHDASGQPLGFIKIARDETERRRQNDALCRSLSLSAALVDLGDRLRSIDDVDAMILAATDIAHQALGISRTEYDLIDPSDESVTIAPGHRTRLGSTGPVWRLAEFGAFADALRAGETVVVDDAASDPRTVGQLDRLRAINTLSLVKLPILEHGRLAAVFCLHHTAPRAWPAEDVAFARTVADRIWAATERLRAEHQLRALNATLGQQVEERTQERDRIWSISQDLMAVLEPDGVLRAVNPAWERVLGYAPAEVIGQPIANLTYFDASQDDRIGDLGMVLLPIAFENRYRHKAGGFRWLSWTAAMGENGLIYVNGRDSTAEKAAKDALDTAEEALRQSQKMEAIGQLTGGIAHDFNNILTGILGSLDIMRRRIEAGRAGEIGKFMDTAYASAQRAASLTHRLLAFARRQSLDAKASDVNQLISGMEDLLHRTLGGNIGLRTTLALDIWQAMADPHQLESAILNLAINARDAMPDGGLLTIETQNATLDAEFVSMHTDLALGDYLVISVSDTGVGMSASVRARAFDPFFTTKPIGQGTGLGLSMVYGFAKQSKGHVRISSEAGRGTTIRLYLPRALDHAHGNASVGALGYGRGGETVLVVEDDDTVRLLITNVLDELGYHYVEATTGGRAIPIIQAPGRIDLMISDVGLPGMNGRQLAEVARQMRPDLKILFVTGYAEMAASRGGFLAPGMDMLTKPFALETLATKIQAMIAPAQPEAD